MRRRLHRPARPTSRFRLGLAAALATAALCTVLAADPGATEPSGAAPAATTVTRSAVSVSKPGPGLAPEVTDGLPTSATGLLVSNHYRCSATVVASNSGQVLATAAHCAWLGGRWQLDGAVFLPGYHHGAEPYGRWPVEAGWVSTAWQRGPNTATSTDPVHDVAFLRLARRDGQRPADVLGAQGITFDAGMRNPAAIAYGYPAVAPYDGESLRRCTSATTPVALRGGTGMQLDCALTPGVSGGPVLTGVDARSGSGRIIGVVSGYDGRRDYAGVFGAEAERLYQAADRDQR